MTGYNIVFDHEKMVLGWKASDCEYYLFLPLSFVFVPVHQFFPFFLEQRCRSD